MSDAPEPAPETAAPAATPKPVDGMIVTDATGRKLRLRILDPGDTMDILEAAGPSSSYPGFMQYAMAVCSVSAINDVPLPLPTDRRALKAAGKLLGNDGFAAMARVLFGANLPDSGTITPEDAVTAKN